MNDIANLLSAHAAGHDRLGALLAASVGRVLLKAAKRGENWRREASEEQLGHIADWLRAALVNNDAWLDNVDDQGRPKKLMKFGSIGQMVQEADKAMMRAAQQLSAVQLTEGDEELFTDLEDGFRLVRLMTPAALDRESSEMQHCIGNGGYDNFLQKEDFLYLSLRDRSGKAHVTLEIEGSTITQIQGKQNRPPIRSYLDKLIPFVRKSGYAIDVPACHLGYAVDIHGDWHDIGSLPPGLTIDGNLYLFDTGITVLPEELTVTGNIDLSGTVNPVLSKGLSVGGNLDLSNTGIPVLPEGLLIGGNFYLNDTHITGLPQGLTVGGWLDLRDTTVTDLPEGLAIGQDLYLAGSNVRVLPQGLKVGRDLYLSGTSIRTLPDSVTDETRIHCALGYMSAKEFRELYSQSELPVWRAPL